MYAEAAGFDSLGVGGAHGDGIRNITGSIGGVIIYNLHQVTGALYIGSNALNQISQNGNTQGGTTIYTDAGRVVPVANKNQPRAWGALACVYLGPPAS